METEIVDRDPVANTPRVSAVLALAVVISWLTFRNACKGSGGGA